MRRTHSNQARGFTLVELALVIVIMGLLLVPITQLLRQSADQQKETTNKTALEATRDALLAYAARNKGCLPHAADFEGGITNTDIAGNAGTNDTGSVRAAVAPANGGAGQRAGDVPWADIGGLSSNAGAGLDSNQHRIQYYVAAAYTSPTQTRFDSSAAGVDNPATRNDCLARVRAGIEIWDNTAQYSLGDVVMAASTLYVATANAPTVGAEPPAGGWSTFAGGSITAWSALVAYTTNAYVSDNGTIYRALQASGGITSTTTTTTTGNSGNNGGGNGNGNNGNGNGNNGNNNGNAGTTTTTTTTTGNPPQNPSTSPAFWRAVGLPGTPTPAWQSNGNYQRGEMVTHNGRIFRMIAAGTTNSTPVAGAAGPTWRDVSTPTLIGGIPKSLETRIGPNIGSATDGQNSTGSLNNVFVLISPGTDPSTDNRPGLRDQNHRTCVSATACGAWGTLNDTIVDARTFSLTPDRVENPLSPDTVLAVSFAEYQAYLQRHGLIAEPLQY